MCTQCHLCDIAGSVRASQAPNSQQPVPASHYSAPHIQQPPGQMPPGQMPHANGVGIDHNDQMDPQRYVILPACVLMHIRAIACVLLMQIEN